MQGLIDLYTYLCSGLTLLTQDSSAKAVQLYTQDYYITYDYAEFISKLEIQDRIFKCFKRKIKDLWIKELRVKHYDLEYITQEIHQALSVIQFILSAYKHSISNPAHLLSQLHYDLNEFTLNIIQEVSESNLPYSISTIKSSGKTSTQLLRGVLFAVPDARKKLILYNLSDYLMTTEDGSTYEMSKDVYCAVILSENEDAIDEIQIKGYEYVLIFCESVLENYDIRINQKFIVFDGLGRKVLKELGKMNGLDQVSQEKWQGFIRVKLKCLECSAPRESYTPKLAMNYESISDVYQPTVTYFIIENVQKYLILITAPADPILNWIKLQISRAIRKLSAIRSSGYILNTRTHLIILLRDSLVNFPFVHGCFSRMSRILDQECPIMEYVSMYEMIKNAYGILIDIAYTMQI